MRRTNLCRISFFFNLTRLFYFCIARVKHTVVVPHFHWRLASVETSVTTLDFSVHFILFSNFVLEITALHILVECLVRGDYFFIHILSIYILCRMVIILLLSLVRNNQFPKLRLGIDKVLRFSLFF